MSETVAKAPPKKPAKKKKVPPKVAIIDESGCTGCEVCIELCPVDCILKFEAEDSKTGIVQVDIERCIGCSICAQFCPWETIPMVDNPLFYQPDEEDQQAA